MLFVRNSGVIIDVGFKSKRGVMTKRLPMVMTVEEVAVYLRIPRSSVYKLAQEGRIPCQKAGRRWRFHRNAVDRWLEGSLDVEKTLSQEISPKV